MATQTETQMQQMVREFRESLIRQRDAVRREAGIGPERKLHAGYQSEEDAYAYGIEYALKQLDIALHLNGFTGAGTEVK